MTLFRGPRALADALRLLRTRRELWPLCALPLVINLLVFGLAAWAFSANLDMLAGWIRSGFELGDPQTWYQWIWIGPLRVLAWLVRWILVLAFAIAVYFAFTLVGAVIASPFLDLLSERVEAIRTGAQPPAFGSVAEMLRAGLTSVLEEGKRATFFIAVQLCLLVFALLPGAQPFALAASALFTALFLPLDYTGYTLDRRRIRFRERRAWVWANRWTMFGFGGTALVSLLVPGLNFLCLPWFVTAGTLLALEVGPPDRLDVVG